MKKLLLALCLIPSVSFAQVFYPTYGCFVEPYQANCSQHTVNCQASPQTNLLWFGSTVGTLCDNYISCASDWYAEKEGRASCLTGYDTLLSQYNSLVNKYNALVKPYNKNLALIKKLRAACGTKCKRIK